MLHKLAILALGASSALLAVDAPLKEAPPVTNTQRVDFPAGGTLRLTNSIGTLTVEGWDQPQMELTTIKSVKSTLSPSERRKFSEELDQVRINVEGKPAEILIDTSFPRHRGFPPGNPWGPGVKFDLEYRIHVPRDAKLVVAGHDVGEIHVDDLINDISVNLLQGEILLHLPQDAKYSIDAETDFGNVNCDYPGEEKRRRWLSGHRWVSGESAHGAHKLDLKVGYGDVVILKTQVPSAPPSLISPPAPGNTPKGL